MAAFEKPAAGRAAWTPAAKAAWARLALAAAFALPLAAGAACLLGATPAQASDVPPPRSSGAPPEDIIVTGRRRRFPDLQETQEFNAEELARLRAEFEPPPEAPPPRHEGDRMSSPRTAGIRAMIQESPRLRDIEIPR
jgi:hypothetical protein